MQLIISNQFETVEISKAQMPNVTTNKRQTLFVFRKEKRVIND